MVTTEEAAQAAAMIRNIERVIKNYEQQNTSDSLAYADYARSVVRELSVTVERHKVGR